MLSFWLRLLYSLLKAQLLWRDCGSAALCVEEQGSEDTVQIPLTALITKSAFCFVFNFSFWYSYLMVLHFLSVVGIGYSFFQACKLFFFFWKVPIFITFHQYIFTWKTRLAFKTSSIHPCIMPTINFISFS